MKIIQSLSTTRINDETYIQKILDIYQCSIKMARRFHPITLYTDERGANELGHLVDEVKLNQIVYESKFSFEPIIGHIYHLYYGDNGKYFLSLIEPEMWNQEYVLSVELNSENKWVLIKEV